MGPYIRNTRREYPIGPTKCYWLTLRKCFMRYFHCCIIWTTLRQARFKSCGHTAGSGRTGSRGKGTGRDGRVGVGAGRSADGDTDSDRPTDRPASYRFSEFDRAIGHTTSSASSITRRHWHQQQQQQHRMHGQSDDVVWLHRDNVLSVFATLWCVSAILTTAWLGQTK